MTTESGILHFIFQFFGTWSLLLSLISDSIFHLTSSCFTTWFLARFQKSVLLYVHVNKYEKRRGHTFLFLNLTIQVLLEMWTWWHSPYQFLSKHGFLTHWFIFLWACSVCLSASLCLCVCTRETSRKFYIKHTAHHITSEDPTGYF